MIKRILVPLDVSPYARAAVARACALAELAGAEITGMVVLDTHGIEKSVQLPFRADLRDYSDKMIVECELEAAEKLQAVTDGFKKMLKKRDLPVRLSKNEGRPSRQILAASCFHDLLIMGLQSYYHFETQRGPGDTLDKVLKDAVIPVMAVPAREADAIQSALILFDGSPASSRALHAFAEIWCYERPAVRLVVADVAQDFGENLLREAARFLQAHGVEKIEQVIECGSVIRAVEERHLDWSDLIVLGVHSGHSVKGMLVGSVARHLIGYGHRALLFSQ
ncbi:MAG: universal stress protein [Verrucomicrobiales bacterium]|nr:universal stress protein [Verrucomicrobiales bacterium]